MKNLSIDDIGKAVPGTGMEFDSDLTQEEADLINAVAEQKVKDIERNVMLANDIHRNTEQWIKQGLVKEWANDLKVEDVVRGAVWHAMREYDLHLSRTLYQENPPDYHSYWRNAPSQVYASRTLQEIRDDYFSDIYDGYSKIFT